MSIRNQVPMSENKLPHGVFQWTMNFDIEAMQVESFQAEGLELPSSLRFAVKKRQIEFLCGRLCAKRCMESLGFDQTPTVLVGEDRAPIWPAGLVGSISHTDRLATAIMGPTRSVEAIGIDIERRIKEATPQMIKHICCELGELDEIADGQQLSREEALTLIFSGKESLYKAIYPKLQRFYGFQAARVSSLGPKKLQIMLETDLNDDFEKGMSWALEVRMPAADLIETIILKGR